MEASTDGRVVSQSASGAIEPDSDPNYIVTPGKPDYPVVVGGDPCVTRWVVPLTSSSNSPPFDARSQLLCGWVHCQDRHLAKYAVALARQGYPSIRTIAPASLIFGLFSRQPLQAWAARLLQQANTHFPGRWVVYGLWLAAR